jgi:putative MFS transporter
METDPTGAFHPAKQVDRDRAVIEISARLDRLPAWGLRPGVLIILVFSWIIVGYDITAVAATLPVLVKDFHSTTAIVSIAVTTNLVAYMVGAYGLGTLADIIGRRRALTISISILTAGAALTGFSWNPASFAAFRTLTGLGMGAQISLATTFATEFSPPKLRGQVVSANTIGLGLGLALPLFVAIPLLGLGPIGWRTEYWLAALAVCMLFFLRDSWMPESPRWLVVHGQADRARTIVAAMEGRLRKRGRVIGPVHEVPAEQPPGRFPTAALLRPPLLGRMVFVFVFWVIWYVWIYGYLVYEPTLVGKLGLPLPPGLLYSGLAFLAFPLGAVAGAVFGDRIPRAYGIAAAAAIDVLGLALMASASTLAMVVAGGALVGFGNLYGVGLAYTYTAELFPTRARASAMSIGDGIGHLGGAIQPYIVLAVLGAFGARYVFAVLGVAAAINCVMLAVSRRQTTGQPLTQVAT